MKKKNDITLRGIFDTFYTGGGDTYGELTEYLSFDDSEIERGVDYPSEIFKELNKYYYCYYYYIRKKGLHFEVGGTCNIAQLEEPKFYDSEGRVCAPTFSENQKGLRLFCAGNCLAVTPTEGRYIKEITIWFDDNNPMFCSTDDTIGLDALLEMQGYWYFEELGCTSITADNDDYPTRITFLFKEDPTRHTGIDGVLRFFNTARRGEWKSMIVKAVSVTTINATPAPYNYTSDIDSLRPFSDIVIDILGDEFNDDYLDELFKKVYLRFADWNIIPYNKGSKNLALLWERWVQKYIGVFVSTKKRYETLLKYYKEEEDNLLARLKGIREVSLSSDNKSRFNDTPQIEDDGSLDGDKYATQISHDKGKTKSKEKTETDPTTIMARLDEIAREYRNVWGEWVDEFKDFFYPRTDEDYYGDSDDE